MVHHSLLLLLVSSCLLAATVHGAAAAKNKGSVTGSPVEVFNFTADASTAHISPENMAFDKDMNLYVTSFGDGRVFKLTKTDAGYTKAFTAQLPGVSLPSSCPTVRPIPATAGIAFKNADHFFVASNGCDEGQGIYLFNTHTMNYTKVSTSVPTDCPGALPALGVVMNGIAVYKRHLYMADTFCGRILRMPVAGGPITVWKADPLLDTIPFDQLPPIFQALGFAPGVNGLKVYKGDLYFTNTLKGTYGKVNIKDNGEPGQIKIMANVSADDFAMDSQGSAWITAHGDNTIVRIDQEGNSKVVVTSKTWPYGPQGPSACAFGTRGKDKHKLFVNMFPLPGTPSPRPSVVKVPLSVKGYKVPQAKKL